ncbi:MAG UNVERIFIED_CONTAM: hypothetical protein LVR18_37540 [Planctomycetaceae bacterium]
MSPDFLHGVFCRDVCAEKPIVVSILACLRRLLEAYAGRDDFCPPGAESPADVVGARKFFRTLPFINLDLRGLAYRNNPVGNRVDTSPTQSH